MVSADLVLLALAVVATLVTAGLLVAFLRADARREGGDAGREDRRRPGDRRRDPREALALVGNALAATHDPRTLLPVVLEVTVEATGAAGGRLREGGEEVAWVGRATAEAPLELPLREPGEDPELVIDLHPFPGGFSPEAEELARWLVSQAAIALENAHLHHLVQRQATTDELTGLVNRRRFLEALTAQLARVERFGGTFSLLLADLDDFKLVNDRFGHEAGDEALRCFADVLTAELRDVDVAGRLGGEEFAVLLPETDLDGGVTVARRIMAALNASAIDLPSAAGVRLTASLGIAEHEGDSAEELLRRADAALYRAKAEGKNRVERAPA